MFTASDQGFIILQNTLLTGITNISFSQDVDEDAVNLLSNGGINRKIKGPPTTTCEITKTYAGRDFFTDLTGFVGLSGQFIYGSDALDFNDAAISSYRLRMDSQGAPEISVNLKIFGDLKPATQLRLSSAAPDEVKNKKNGSSTTFSYMGKNSPISQFSVSAAFDLKPTYEIESIKSSAVRIVPPVQFSSSATMELTEQEYENISGLLESENFDRKLSLSFEDEAVIEKVLNESGKLFSLTGQGLETGRYRNVTNLFNTGIAKLNSYIFEGFGLRSQNISLSNNDTIKLDVDFNGYSTNLPVGSAPSAPAGSGIQARLNNLTNQVDAAIENFTTGFLEVPKVTGDTFAFEDFQSLNEGSVEFSRISKHLHLPFEFEHFEAIDFQNETVGNITTDLYLPSGTASITFTEMGLILFDAEITDFQDQSVGPIELYLVPIRLAEITDFQNESVGSTNTNLTSFE
jgi:hypothetical protein